MQETLVWLLVGKIHWIGYPLQYYSLKYSMDRGAWWAIVHGVTKSWTWLSNFHFSSWLRDACICMGGCWDTPDMNCEPGRSKWLDKGNSEEMPHESDSNCHECVTLSLWVHLFASPHVLYSVFPPDNTLLALLPSTFVEIISCKAEGSRPLSLTTGLVVRIWCSHSCDPTSISA